MQQQFGLMLRHAACSADVDALMAHRNILTYFWSN